MCCISLKSVLNPTVMKDKYVLKNGFKAQYNIKFINLRLEHQLKIDVQVSITNILQLFTKTYTVYYSLWTTVRRFIQLMV